MKVISTMKKKLIKSNNKKYEWLKKPWLGLNCKVPPQYFIDEVHSL